MKRKNFFGRVPRLGMLLGLLLAGVGTVTEVAAAETGDTLKVLTYNVWHGLRSGESNKRFPGEEPEDKESRFAAQIRRDPAARIRTCILLPGSQPQSARRHASTLQALGYDEIHKVTSCGLHLGGIYKIPRNMNEGIAILARPELGLKRVGKKRLSGNATCTATYGFQTKESRYALFGEITVGGRSLLVATTHLSAPPFVLSDFEENLEGLVEEGDPGRGAARRDPGAAGAQAAEKSGGGRGAVGPDREAPRRPEEPGPGAVRRLWR